MIRAGLAQMDIIWEDIRANEQKVRRFFEEAALKQVDLLVFPEMTLTGFSMNVDKTTRDWERQPDFFRRMSKEYQMAVVFGYPSAPAVSTYSQGAGAASGHGDMSTYNQGAGTVSGHGDRSAGLLPGERAGGAGLCRNHLAVFYQGDQLMDYAKIHPFTFGVESQYFEGGDRIFTAEFRDTVLGGFVCYDLRFPEIFQYSSVKSEIIFVIANWPKERIGHWDILLQARAIENQCYIVGVNRTGAGGGLVYTGHSAVFSPEGGQCTPLSEEETLLVADIDPGRVRSCREVFPLKKDRRCDLYEKLKYLS